jgi:hypothetical protein
MAGTLLQLASAPLLRRRLGTAGAATARARTWERSLGQLAVGYRRALGAEPAAARQGLVQVA